MDFPAFHLDFWGNRTLIGVIAVLHVFINHALAVGAMPLITVMEWRAHRRSDPELDGLAYRALAVCFIITTSIGALTGVGIWFSTSLVNPYAIGSLIRVFFWAWFTEWIVFAAEVSLILAYFLTWKRWSQTPATKRRHIGLGILLSISSFLTMAVIVAILGFMMDTGNWPQRPGLLSGVFNPIYLPQLLFRTPAAMMTAGFFVLFLVYFFTRGRRELRTRAVRFVSLWSLAWAPLCLGGALLYWNVIPEGMAGHLDVALATQAFAHWHDMVAYLILAAVVIAFLVAVWGVAIPRYLPRVVLLVPFILALGLLGMFERVREFIRKPYVIENYMYANGIRQADYPVLAEEGLLAHAAYLPARTVTADNRAELGQAVFIISCSRCHTTTGVNGIVEKLSGVVGRESWDRQAVRTYLPNMHNIRPFMPPVPGNDEDLDLLTDYLLALQTNPQPLGGAQRTGVAVPPG